MKISGLGNVVMPLPDCGSCDCAFKVWNGRKGGLAIHCTCSKDALLRGLQLLADREEILGALRCGTPSCTRSAGHEGAHGRVCPRHSCDLLAGHDGEHLSGE